MRKLLFAIILLICSYGALAQRVTGAGGNDEDDPYDAKTYFMAGLNYLSNTVYLGRKDTVAIPYISPYIGYHHKTGVYVKAMASWSPNTSRIDLVTLEAGYDHTFGDHLNMGISADKFFYSKKSNSVRGNTTGSAGMYLQYGNDWVEPQVSFDVNFNKKTDYALGLQLDHDFRLMNKTLSIIPAVTMNAGTQHYYDEYFVNKLTKKDKSVKVKNALTDAGKFKVLDYEMSLASSYRISKWLFKLTATYAIPVSPATITFPKQTFTEQLSNTFFLELDICYR